MAQQDNDREVAATSARFAALRVDPSQVAVLAAGQPEPETLDAYVRRVAREEARNATATARLRAVGRSA